MSNFIGLTVLAVFGVLRAGEVRAPPPALTPLAVAGTCPRMDEDLSGTGWSLWLDRAASWKDDELYLPGADVSKLPVNPPTGGWNQLTANAAKAVSVPGTVEEYFGGGHDPHIPQLGVSWWFRTMHIPEAAGPKRVLLRFDSIRLRAEIYVNRRLVAYDLVGDTPLEVDLSGIVKPGDDAQLAVRVTNPGGNFDWVDFHQIRWGKYLLPAGHAFSGVTGPVDLRLVDPIYIADVYMQNTPDPHAVNAIVTIIDCNSARVKGDLSVHVTEKAAPGTEVFARDLTGVDLKPGPNEVTVRVNAPEAKIWDLDHPNLYVAAVALKSPPTLADLATRTFGFRWFSPEGIGTNAMYRLNGKRIFLRTAISWGFWPINGIFPTPDLAEKQIRDAKTYGLNMLNFHRCIGNPVVLDKADELGLLYFEEPGGYVSGGGEAFGQALAREKLFRMIRRDRSHPSLVIFNMINEQYDEFHAKTDEKLFAIHRQDQIDAHALDPSRSITYTSMVASLDKINFPEKDRMNMRPFDNTQYMTGEMDHHRADGPEEGVWVPDYYRNPQSHYGLTKDAPEIVYWGEEGATPSPPRLELIKKELESAPNKGWDGETYLQWYKEFDDYLTRKHLRGSFPTVDSLTIALGAPALEQQGRKIEDTRICDLNDGYAINGWESELFENHSGIVDCFRNPKSDPAILAYYNRPLYLAVKCRSQIVQIPNQSLVDFYLINEKNVSGPKTLRIRAVDPAGREVFHAEKPVTVTGGDVFGELLDEAVAIPIAGGQGFFTVQASLVDANGKVEAAGHDRIFAVDWKTPVIPGKGAIWEWGSVVRNLLGTGKGLDVPPFDPAMGSLDWILVAAPATPPIAVIPQEALFDATGTRPGLTATFFKDKDYRSPLGSRTDPTVDFVWSGKSPDPSIDQDHDYWVRWEGRLNPPVSGRYLLSSLADDEAQLWIEGRPVFANGGQGESQAWVSLEAGKPVGIRYDYHQGGGGAEVHLRWAVPDPALSARMAGLFERARDDGTKLIFIEGAETWMDQISRNSQARYSGTFTFGGAGWVSGRYFVKKHPLFKDLPVDQALNWPYVSILHKTRGDRLGLNVEGEELVAGAYNTYPMHLGTAVGIVPCGRGKIIFSVFPILSELDKPPGVADVARKLLVDYLQYAGEAR